MDIGPKRRRMMFGLIAFSVILALAILLTAFDLWDGRIRIFVLIGIFLFPLFIAAFATVLFRNPTTLLTLSPEGIFFRLPALGLVPWRDIASAEIVRSGPLRVRCLGIEFAGPMPKAGLLLLSLVGIGKKKIDGRQRLIFALRQLDRSEAEIEEALARLRPASAKLASGQSGATARAS